jgi:hypothetical protein
MRVNDAVDVEQHLMPWLSQAISFYDVGPSTQFLKTTFSGNMAKAAGKPITFALLAAADCAI